MISPLRRSVRLKVAAIVAIAIALSMTIASAASGWREYSRLSTLKHSELEAMAAALAVTLEPPLKASAAVEVQRTLRAVGRMAQVTYAQVVDSEGAVVAAFGNGVVVRGSDGTTEEKAAGGSFSLSTVPVEAPIISGGVPDDALKSKSAQATFETTYRAKDGREIPMSFSTGILKSAEGQASGAFAAKIAPETAGLALVAAWNAIAISWAKTGDTRQAAEAHWQTLDLFLNGLLARA